MLEKANWIGLREEMGSVCPTFTRAFSLAGEVAEATLHITAVGVYDVYINGSRVSREVLAPGCTSYQTRLQVQTYDIRDLLHERNVIDVTVGSGWHRGRVGGGPTSNMPCAIIGEIRVTYAGGQEETIPTDGCWEAHPSPVVFSDIYDGETCDMTASLAPVQPVQVLNLDKARLIPHEGAPILEQEQLSPISVFTTPKGETVIDFGQNLTGYVVFRVNAHAGDEILISYAEVLDAEGNFYTDNYRGAKSKLRYVCCEGCQSYKPRFTFFGFRYIRLDQWPGEVHAEDFQAIAVYSEMRRTGDIRTGSPLVNRLFENVLWSQRGNYLDVPTDCPQRDERLGWTGDAQAFAKTACYNYDVRQFMHKWLRDLCADQMESGAIPNIIPNLRGWRGTSTAWADVVTILPWQMYITYADTQALEETFEAMRRWVDFIGQDTGDAYLWTKTADMKAKGKDKHYGDWLGLDAPAGSYRGSTDEDLIASAFYAHSTHLLVKAGHALGRNVSAYEELYRNIVRMVKATYNTPKTQTEHVLLLHFHLTDHPEEVAASLNKMILDNGCKLKTGFVGTPYLLHALSDNGYADTAWSLLLQEEHPSWLFEVTHGATTIWEHWDGVNDEGQFWSSAMNSFNHYAYGTVMDWVYEQAAGIQPIEEAPGFAKVRIAPKPDRRLGWLDVTFDTDHGTIRSAWCYRDGQPRYTITTPVDAILVVDGKETIVGPGTYLL